MLPAIYFIFSRAGCDAAALSAVLESGVRLTTADEREKIGPIAEERHRPPRGGRPGVLGLRPLAVAIRGGAAAHHAGLVPAFKETVEHLFAAGLMKVVFATETLALGINMPARTVVLERSPSGAARATRSCSPVTTPS